MYTRHESARHRGQRRDECAEYRDRSRNPERGHESRRARSLERYTHRRAVTIVATKGKAACAARLCEATDSAGIIPGLGLLATCLVPGEVYRTHF